MFRRVKVGETVEIHWFFKLMNRLHMLILFASLMCYLIYLMRMIVARMVMAYDASVGFAVDRYT